jgi:hypothetical protein
MLCKRRRSHSKTVDYKYYTMLQCLTAVILSCGCYSFRCFSTLKHPGPLYLSIPPLHKHLHAGLENSILLSIDYVDDRFNAWTLCATPTVNPEIIQATPLTVLRDVVMGGILLEYCAKHSNTIPLGIQYSGIPDKIGIPDENRYSRGSQARDAAM